jgi:hypothetical protein
VGKGMKGRRRERQKGMRKIFFRDNNSQQTIPKE